MLTVTTFRLKGFVLGALWLLIITVCMAGLWRYQNTSNGTGVVAQRWPAGAAFAPDKTVNTLVMFTHPHCPCTRSSIEELNRLMAKGNGRLAAHVLFFSPREMSEEWTKTSLRRNTAWIPGVSVHDDLDGAQARLFGATTSGFVLLYNPQGQLLFSGGITGSRGHAGDNLGEDTVVALINGRETSVKETPVYGCSLLGECKIPASGATQ